MDDRSRALTPLTVLFADISASTSIYVERGDATAFSLTDRCLGVVERYLRDGGGRIRKRLGDGLLATFGAPEAALRAAVAAHDELVTPTATLLREGVHIRFGISCGSAVDTGDDVFGDAVNIAARLQALASSDEIFISGQAYQQLPPALRAKIRLIDRIHLRNRPGDVEVYEWIGEEVDATVGVDVRPRATLATLEITHGERAFVVGPERAKVSIGRHASHDIHLEHEGISRTHAEVLTRGGRFVLIDRSTNGTYVYVDQGPVHRVLRDELTLSGSGRIVAGVELEPSIRYRTVFR
jgi:class 3 adenylate cyclase